MSEKRSCRELLDICEKLMGELKDLSDYSEAKLNGWTCAKTYDEYLAMKHGQSDQEKGENNVEG
jgi:hypothetical protein